MGISKAKVWLGQKIFKQERKSYSNDCDGEFQKVRFESYNPLLIKILIILLVMDHNKIQNSQYVKKLLKLKIFKKRLSPWVGSVKM